MKACGFAIFAICLGLWLAPVAEAAELLEPEAAASLLKEQAAPVILDVRTPREFYAGHLPGARNLDYYGPDFDKVLGELDPGQTYLVYCQSGKRSAAAVTAMEKSGLKNVREIAGGFSRWQKAGLPWAKQN